ncbi:Spy/CpxP family protein refolding chaperone [Vibrio parahaemolyticus]|uniref:Spy/CpxP family protein refolding chaperone n=2 Tax=Vibrio parahaemolyticus TaxID=670 RepID=UPI00215217ED|nr:Spy/CpxP family protein refolding chaperone [Vibrio parahaemolyticus]
MFIRAYLRASTTDQDADRAKNELQAFAQEHNDWILNGKKNKKEPYDNLSALIAVFIENELNLEVTMKRYFFTLLLSLASYQTLADAPKDNPAQPVHTQQAPKPFGLDDISAAQLQEMANIRNQYMTQINAKQPAIEDIQKDTKEWETLLKASSFDEAKARVFLQKMANQQLEMELLQAKADNATYNVLTQKQKDELAKQSLTNQ